MPRVSVIIPTCNRASLLERSVQSVLEQNCEDCEVIVVDDGSSDRTGAVMEKFKDRIRYYAKENGGVASARNYGINKAGGDLIAWLDDDDYFLPGKLQKQVDYFSANPGVGLVYTGHVMIDSTGTGVRKSYFSPPLFRDCTRTREALLKQCFFANSTVMMKRDCFDKAGFFNESLSHTVDYEMWLRVAAYCRFGGVQDILTAYCLHGKQLSFRRDARILKSLRAMARELYKNNPCRKRG